MDHYPKADCLQCQKVFEKKRSDHFFCSGACCAAYYRDNPNPEYIHKELPHDKPHVCEECGQPYTVNAYAERGGKRTNRFCSPKCKQKSWRTAQKQAERRYAGGTQREDNSQKSSGKSHSYSWASEEEKRRAEEEFWRQWRQNRQNTGSEQRRRPVGKTGMTRQAALDLFGLSEGFTQAELKKVYFRMAYLHHPDYNKAADANEKMQKVNAAYEVLKSL